MHGAPATNNLGLALLECWRGTSITECVHKQVEHTFGSWHTGSEMGFALLAVFRHMYTQGVSERRRLGFPRIGHFCTWLIDKIQLLVETLESVVSEGHKALVFSQWTSMLDRVEPALKEAGIPYVRLDGSTRNRGAVVGRFQDPAGPPVFLISLKAGGTGLNLTAADHVFLLDPWWNPAVEEQAADRAHRIGQDKPVFVYRLVTTDTVEERILELQDRKRALADAALGEASQAGGITRDELLALLL